VLTSDVSKSGQEPECGHENALLSGRTIYIWATTSKEKMSRRQFRRIIKTMCQRWHIPEYSDYVSKLYWPAFSRLDDAGQRAFWHVLGV
jgi:hypothetical protein